MIAKTIFFKVILVALLISNFGCSVAQIHPNLVITQKDVANMRDAIETPGLFKNEYESKKAYLDRVLKNPIVVPVPKDGGGGYTHERHKKNYQLMFDAGLIYQLSGNDKYSTFVKDMLMEYARLYPTLDLHPQRKVNSQNPGKFFWQSLNEAVWLVYTIQAYDLIIDSLSSDEQKFIESNLLRPVALFLSEGQPSTFNKVHNHGTWATAGVGMAGYVLGEPDWTEKALYDLNKSGKGGFLKQLDELFSPDGYYNEGPYYQRYALFPFITFAKAIENNDPERNIFEYRDQILLKAIDATIQLSYNRLFFPINDAIKSKGIDTIELVHGVTVAYGLTKQPGYLDIAKQQDQIILSGDGLLVAQAIDAGLQQPYEFKSLAYGDGSDGKQGALVIKRSNTGKEQAVLFKAAAQGLGHGHFDKLTWQYYDHGNEIVSDYGAARFLNVEAKFGGRYLPENETYAKQTVAHNTVVVDEKSHFNADVKIGNANHPTLRYFGTSDVGTVSNAYIKTAYNGILLDRTLALVELKELNTTIVVDIFNAEGQQKHQYDLPLHYLGQFIEANFKIEANTTRLPALGYDNGYQHLWLTGSGVPEKKLAKVTWLNDNGRFYTLTSLANNDETFLFTKLGANDPNFNLRNEHGFIRRVTNAKEHSFVSILEPHGEYNPSKEYTLDATSKVSNLEFINKGDALLVKLEIADLSYLIAINHDTHQTDAPLKVNSVEFDGNSYTLKNRLNVFLLTN